MKKVIHDREEALAAHKLARTEMANKNNLDLLHPKNDKQIWLYTRNIETNHHKKNIPKCEGSFKIDEVLGPITYKLKLPESWRIHNVFHATLLCPYIENKIYGNKVINTASNGKDFLSLKQHGKMSQHFQMMKTCWNNINSDINSKPPFHTKCLPCTFANWCLISNLRNWWSNWMIRR